MYPWLSELKGMRSLYCVALLRPKVIDRNFMLKLKGDDLDEISNNLCE